MKKTIQILAGYAVMFCIYAIWANFSLVGQGIKMTVLGACLTALFIAPIIILSILLFVYFYRK